MATSWLLLSAVLLLSVLGAASAVTIDGSGSASYGDECRLGRAVPHNPLPTCRAYVNDQECRNAPDDPVQKARCCRELAAIPELCRCEALRVLRHGVVTEEGIFEGGLGDIPGCSESMGPRFGLSARFLSSDPEYGCNLRTFTGGTDCPSY